MIIILNKEMFRSWLREHSDLKEYTINRYVAAISTISSELVSYGLVETNLYATDEYFVETIKSNSVFQQKNKKGNGMYSAALNKLNKFLKFYYNQEFLKELFHEKLEYDNNVITYISMNNFQSVITDEKRIRPLYKMVNHKKVWRRNARISGTVLAKSNFKCEIDNEHQHFISRYNNENYVEAHHIIPMSQQEDYEHSLDVYANIVSLCMVCHKILHFAHFKNKNSIKI